MKTDRLSFDTLSKTATKTHKNSHNISIIANGSFVTRKSIICTATRNRRGDSNKNIQTYSCLLCSHILSLLYIRWANWKDQFFSLSLSFSFAFVLKAFFSSKCPMSSWHWIFRPPKMKLVNKRWTKVATLLKFWWFKWHRSSRVASEREFVSVAAHRFGEEPDSFCSLANLYPACIEQTMTRWSFYSPSFYFSFSNLSHLISHFSCNKLMTINIFFALLVDVDVQHLFWKFMAMILCINIYTFMCVCVCTCIYKYYYMLLSLLNLVFKLVSL